MHYKVLCVQKLWFFCGFVVQSVQNGGESDESAGCGKRGGGLCRSAHLLPLAGCCRDVVLTLSATPWGRGTRRCSRRSREQREAAAKAAAFAALREAQCGARAAPRRFRRGAPNGGICTCAENAAFGEVEKGARAGKAAVRYRSAFAKGADGVYIKGSAE